MNFTASAKPLSGGAGTGESLLQAQCMIFTNNDPAKKEATQQFIEYLVSNEQLGDYIANVTPAYPACESMKDVALNLVLAGAAGSGEHVMQIPLLAKLNDLNLELRTLAQAITVGGKDVPTAIQEFGTAWAAIIAE